MIGKLLGHPQVQTTARYVHLTRNTVKASAARIGDSFEHDLDACHTTRPINPDDLSDSFSPSAFVLGESLTMIRKSSVIRRCD